MTLSRQSEGRKLLIEFYKAIDEYRFADAARRFASAGEWHRKGEVLIGPDEVERAYEGRNAQLRTRHILSNILIDETPDGLRFHLCITLYAGNAGADETPTVSGPAMVLTSDGQLTRSGGLLKIARKRTVRQFVVQQPNA
ncbi:nuclear transport factor 2 family protein [Thalassovita sp.]|uniref:nuclear transport factor 2 family protein n=1 Tax=Thalassovita sp. TaxID=1979401 RepID=UPI0029DE59FE|nr:nuclear transport factor 2 family protein [Thalassovita sp.]